VSPKSKLDPLIAAVLALCDDAGVDDVTQILIMRLLKTWRVRREAGTPHLVLQIGDTNDRID
jgi:hypothetical protein